MAEKIRPAEGIHVEWIDREAVALDEVGGHLHHLNASAALVYALILEHGFAKGLAKLRAEHDLPSAADEHISSVIDELTKRGLLVRE